MQAKSAKGTQSTVSQVGIHIDRSLLRLLQQLFALERGACASEAKQKPKRCILLVLSFCAVYHPLSTGSDTISYVPYSRPAKG